MFGNSSGDSPAKDYAKTLSNLINLEQANTYDLPNKIAKNDDDFSTKVSNMQPNQQLLFALTYCLTQAYFQSNDLCDFGRCEVAKKAYSALTRLMPQLTAEDKKQLLDFLIHQVSFIDDREMTFKALGLLARFSSDLTPFQEVVTNLINELGEKTTAFGELGDIVAYIRNMAPCIYQEQREQIREILEQVNNPTGESNDTDPDDDIGGMELVENALELINNAFEQEPAPVHENQASSSFKNN